MPLGEDYPRLMFDKTDGMHGRALFLFKLQAPSLRFSINGQCTGSSFLLVLLKQGQKNTPHSRFYLLSTQFPKEPLNGGLMGRDSFLKSERLFDLITLSRSPLGNGQF